MTTTNNLSGGSEQQAFDPRVKVERKVRARNRGRIVFRLLLVLTVVVVILSLCAAWLAYRATQVQSALEATLQQLPALQTQLADGDTDSAQDTLTSLRENTAQARTAATDPLWRAASIVPIAGPNFSAVTEVSVSADDVVNRAVAPLLGQFSSLDWDALTPSDGVIDVTPLEEASPSLDSAANTVQLSHDRLAAIDGSALLPQVSGPLAEAVETLGQADAALSAASAAAMILPPMLGSDEPRNYLILIQNSAEVRATGGIPGALAVISADDGEIELIDQGSAGDIDAFRPPLDVDPEQELIYTDRLGTQIQNVNLTPDFPTAAQTARTMWERRNEGASIDGVIALDPVTLANILQATGPIVLDDPEVSALLDDTSLPTTLDADNVVETLLSTVYDAIEEPALQDAYFAAVAGEVFNALASGQGNSGQLIQSLIVSSEQNRLYVWSADPEEQDVIAPTALAGSVTGASVGGASFGLYFNDGTGAKMDYYVERTARLVQNCNANGYSTFTVEVTLTNTAPADAAASLPAYVTGGGVFGVEPGHVRTNAVMYGPAQSLLGTARIDGEQVPLASHQHEDRPVGVVTTELAPGDTATVEMDFSKVVQESEPILDVTPTIESPQDVMLPLAKDASCSSVP